MISAVSECSGAKLLVARERQELTSAREACDSSAARVEEIFVLLRQQQANVDALSSVVAQADADANALQRRLHTTDERRRQLTTAPEVMRTQRPGSPGYEHSHNGPGTSVEVRW